MENTIEQTIVLQLLYNQEYAGKVLSFIKDDYFKHPSYKTLFDYIQKYYYKYKTYPTLTAIKVDLDNDRTLKQPVLEDIWSILNSSVDQKENTDWLVERAEKFCQESALANAIGQSIDILDGKSKNTKFTIPQLLTEALAVSFNTSLGIDYFEDADQRFDAYHKQQSRIRFGMESFNLITGGGLHRKTINIVQAGTNVGKSLSMCHFAAEFLMQQYNVVYITLELAKNIVTQRIDANLFNIPIDQLPSLPKSVFSSKLSQLKKKSTGRLFVEEYPTASAGIHEFSNYLKELKLKKNFKADVVIIDYLGVTKSAFLAKSARADLYTYGKSLAEEMRQFAGEEDVAVITGIQNNRTGMTDSNPGMEHTADSIAIPFTADLVIGLNQQGELKDLCQFEVKQLKNRYNDIQVCPRFFIGVDKTKMRLYDIDQPDNKVNIKLKSPEKKIYNGQLEFT